MAEPASEPYRCMWCTGRDPSKRNPTMVAYHDTEWGVPLHDDRKHFEFMLLDAFQAGLSWAIVLAKREGFRKAFADFDPNAIARFNARSVERLVGDVGIVRNRQKIEASIANARAFLEVQEEFGSFDAYIWGFVDGEPVRNTWSSIQQIPAKTPRSDAMSKALVKRGFKFVGSTICYAYMQAAGLVNDHETACFRHAEVGAPPRRPRARR